MAVWNRSSFHYLDSWLFPEKRNGSTDLYEGWDSVIQENNLFKTMRKVNLQCDKILPININQKPYNPQHKQPKTMPDKGQKC